MTKVSRELKDLIIQADRDGETTSSIAEKLKINLNTVKTVIYRFKKYKVVERERGHRPKKLTPEMVLEVQSWFDNDCQTTLATAADRIKEKFDIEIHPASVRNYLKEVHFSVKIVSLVPERRNCESTKLLRKEYALKFLEIQSSMNKIFYVDETGVQINVRSRRGWARKGCRANLTVKAIRSKSLSVCAAMNNKSLFLYEVKEHGYDTISFVDFLKQLVDFFDSEQVNGAYVIMDNVRFHHRGEVKELIEGKGHNLIFLPPYSPFLNPIENLFNQFKHHIKRQKPTTCDDVFAAANAASQVITEQHCNNYFSHMMKYLGRCINMETIEN
ncbi:uncharacterized protein LOC112539884 [Tetranychus urticae]|uniref:uncharacterized protein LOC112539884 n=1 Tax=Tetranychus urticae TaxID=32264 RepID=UPI000D64BDD2|nr:uncharacterized protein LOC112539884 [Tetranychus urticae]XP_025018436.1 uncharacterized protein LOC112539884 [Tetranychus urticae]